MRKPTSCIYAKTKVHINLCAADQQLCFHYIGITIPLLPKFQAPRKLPCPYSPVCVENPEDRFSRDEAHIMKDVTLVSLT